MKRVFLVCLACFLVSSFVYGEERFDVEDVSFKAECDGTVQKYVRLLAKNFDESKSHDLVIGLHGHGSNRWQFADQTKLTGLAIRNTAIKYNMIVVCPDYRATTSWMGPKAEADLLQIIEDMKKQYKIDKVILSGGSMGGSSTLTFAAMHPELIDGAVSINGTANHLEYTNFQAAISASFGGSKKEIPLEYKKRSAEYWPESFTMPLGVAVSGKDTIVPPDSVLRLVDILEKMGRDVKLIYSPEKGHSTGHEITEKLFDYVIGKVRGSGGAKGCN